MTLKEKLIERLQALKNLDYTDRIKARASDVKAENALNTIYQTGLKKITFTAEDKQTLGPLLANAIKPIQVNIEITASIYRTKLENSVLIKRSAIQFLIDSYSQFPVGGGVLAQELEKADIQESVEVLDDIIDTWCDTCHPDEVPSDRESAGSEEVPSSHTWWSK